MLPAHLHQRSTARSGSYAATSSVYKIGYSPVTRLNASLAADTGLIQTSRTTQFTATVAASDVLTAAAVIDPEPLSATEAAYPRTGVPPSLNASGPRLS